MSERSHRSGVTAIFAIGVLCLAAGEDLRGQAVCSNEHLREAMRIIQNACHEIGSCNFDDLRRLEHIPKPKLLAAWKEPEMYAIHVFFPANVTDLDGAHDWDDVSELLQSVRFQKTENAQIFVIGQASRSGSYDENVALSRRRMQSVLSYLRDTVQVKCHSFKGGYLGKEFLQLTKRDAQFLGIDPVEYRDSELVLNQAVHVFIFPCSDAR